MAGRNEILSIRQTSLETVKQKHLGRGSCSNAQATSASEMKFTSNDLVLLIPVPHVIAQ